MVKLKALVKTLIKAKPEQSSALAEDQLIRVAPEKELAILDSNIVEDKGGHFKITFEPEIEVKLGGIPRKWKEGYIFGPHWEGISNALKAKAAIATPYSPSGSSIFLQHTPLFNQNDNKDWNDDGSASNLRYGGVQCGLSSLAMVVATLWPNEKVKELAKTAENGQFENWIASQFKKIGAQSTLMEGHVAVLKHLGIKSVARRDATIGDLKQALQKHPCILGTAYKSSGHFVAGVGIADKPGDLPEKWMVGDVDKMIAYPQDIPMAGVIINDPFGQRDYSGSYNNWKAVSHNRTDTFGLHNVLPVNVLENIWVDGGDASGWAVFVDPSTPNAGNGKEPPIVLQALATTSSTTSSTSPSSSSAQSDNLSTVTISKTTFLKREPKQSSELAPGTYEKLVADTILRGIVRKAINNHLEITLLDGKHKGIFYIYSDHCTVITPGGISPTTPGGAITEADYDRVAKLIGCETRALKAVVKVEAAGSGFFPDGRCKILFEAHWFADLTNHKYNASHPDISSRTWNRNLYVGGPGEWKRWEKAAKLDRKAAIGSASYGLGQIMGAYAWEMPAMKIPGATDLEKAENFLKLNETESGQLEAMGRFIMADSRLVYALKHKNWAAFAEAYNGEGYALNQYDIKLADAYESFG